MTPVLGPVEARLVLDLAGLPSVRLEHTLTHGVLAAIPAAHEHYRPRSVRAAPESSPGTSSARRFGFLMAPPRVHSQIPTARWRPRLICRDSCRSMIVPSRSHSND